MLATTRVSYLNTMKRNILFIPTKCLSIFYGASQKRKEFKGILVGKRGSTCSELNGSKKNLR